MSCLTRPTPQNFSARLGKFSRKGSARFACAGAQSRGHLTGQGIETDLLQNLVEEDFDVGFYRELKEIDRLLLELSRRLVLERDPGRKVPEQEALEFHPGRFCLPPALIRATPSPQPHPRCQTPERRILTALHTSSALCSHQVENWRGRGVD